MFMSQTLWRPLRRGHVASLALLAGFLAATPSSHRACADDQKFDADFRIYLAVPFVATHERKAARLGLQMLSDIENRSEPGPLAVDRQKQPAIDLGFTRNGLDKFEVIGADMRGAYDSFARAIGLTPAETELCRDADCLDWVKPEQKALAPTHDLGEE